MLSVRPFVFSGALAALLFNAVIDLYQAYFEGDETADLVFQALNTDEVRDALRTADPGLRFVLPASASRFQPAVDLILATVKRGSDQQRIAFERDPSSFLSEFSENDVRTAEGLPPILEGNRTIGETIKTSAEKEESFTGSVRNTIQDVMDGAQRALTETAIWVGASLLLVAWLNK